MLISQIDGIGYKSFRKEGDDYGKPRSDLEIELELGFSERVGLG